MKTKKYRKLKKLEMYRKNSPDLLAFINIIENIQRYRYVTSALQNKYLKEGQQLQKDQNQFKS